MDSGLKGRIALVTGSSSGLGRAIAEKLAAQGAVTIINGRDPVRTKRTADELSSKYGVTTYPYPADALAKGKNIKFLGEFIRTTLGRLDILVNNVGNLEKFGLFFDLGDEDWLRQYELTCLSAVRFTRACYPYLKESGNGRIINIGSVPARQPGRANPHYAAAKAALLPLTKMWANEFAKDNVLVNMVCPSTLSGGGWQKNVLLRAQRDGITSEEAERLMTEEENKKSPLGRMGTLEDVANLVAFLASDSAGFITGECINIDGGLTRTAG